VENGVAFLWWSDVKQEAPGMRRVDNLQAVGYSSEVLKYQ